MKFSLALITPSVLLLSALSVGNAIEFHRDLPADQRRALEYDLAYLDRVNTSDDPWTTATLRPFQIQGRITTAGPKEYPNPNILSVFEKKNSAQWANPQARKNFLEAKKDQVIFTKDMDATPEMISQ